MTREAMTREARRSLPAGWRHEAEALAIGASAGGIDALIQLLGGLPAGFALPVVVVLHLPEDRESLLGEVFGRRTLLPVREATDKQPVEAGTVYVAPPGYHLLMEADRSFSLSCDPPQHYSRPSIDVLMESMADALGARLVGVLLTGANEDGAAGLARIGAAGGLAVVQNPEEAASPEMPRAALALRTPDFVLALKEIGNLLSHLEPLPCHR